jgi:hypothetical protein
VLHEVVRRREAADAQRQQDPAAGVRRLRGVVRQLLADLTVDLVPKAVKLIKHSATRTQLSTST